MTSDITLAIGDGARRMTYAELAEARGISVPSARRLVLRNRWARQKGNDGYVRVTVPLSALAAVPPATDDTARRGNETGSWSNYLLQHAWNPTQLYRHYDADGVLLYVGISHSSRDRLDQHQHQKSPWYRQVVRILVESFPTQIEARHAEEAAVLVEKPLHNSPRKFRSDAERLAPPTLQPIGDPIVLHRHHGDIEVVPVRRHSATSEETNGDVPTDVTLTKGVPIEAIRTLEKAIDTLAKQLDEERIRTADAQAAERIARDEAAGLRAEKDARKQWGLWRRVRGR